MNKSAYSNDFFHCILSWPGILGLFPHNRLSLNFLGAWKIFLCSIWIILYFSWPTSIKTIKAELNSKTAKPGDELILDFFRYQTISKCSKSHKAPHTFKKQCFADTWAEMAITSNRPGDMQLTIIVHQIVVSAKRTGRKSIHS